MTTATADEAASAATTAGAVDLPLLRLLSDPLRARIVQLLAVEQLCTCHLVELTGARQTNISNHLRALREAGLVSAEPCGRFTYYRLEPAALAALGAQLADLAQAATVAATRRRPC
jgi:ArsR family transcriptional regulator